MSKTSSRCKCDTQVEFLVTRLEALWSDKCELIQQNAELKMELMLLKQQQPQQLQQPQPEQQPQQPQPEPKTIKVVEKVPSMVA